MKFFFGDLVKLIHLPEYVGSENEVIGFDWKYYQTELIELWTFYGVEGILSIIVQTVEKKTRRSSLVISLKLKISSKVTVSE